VDVARRVGTGEQALMAALATTATGRRRLRPIAVDGRDDAVRGPAPDGSRWVNHLRGATIGPMTSPHIVVVEDDQAIGASLERTLVGQGYEVSWAKSGGDGLAAVRGSTALVILDLGLPDVEGLEVCRLLRARVPSPQVLMLTARDDEAD